MQSISSPLLRVPPLTPCLLRLRPDGPASPHACGSGPVGSGHVLPRLHRHLCHRVPPLPLWDNLHRRPRAAPQPVRNLLGSLRVPIWPTIGLLIRALLPRSSWIGLIDVKEVHVLATYCNTGTVLQQLLNCLNSTECYTCGLLCVPIRDRWSLLHVCLFEWFPLNYSVNECVFLLQAFESNNFSKSTWERFTNGYFSWTRGMPYFVIYGEAKSPCSTG